MIATWKYALPLSLVLLVMSCGAATHQDQIKERILQDRQKKDQYFFTNENSPISGEEKNRFEGLRYFPVDLDYRIITTIRPYSTIDTVIMAAGRDQEQRFLRWGEFNFTINGHQGKLHVYKPLEVRDGYHPYYFIPFYDATKGQLTYGGGRYIDIPIHEGKKYVIDFNQAYNPYCAYDPAHWICPLPPRENTLDFAVQAGEKILN